MSTIADEKLLIGRILSTFGVKGWVKVMSFTEDRAGIAAYRPWQLMLRGQWKIVSPLASRQQGKGVVAHLDGVESCEEAERLIGADIYIDKSLLATPEQGVYYWFDLEGLRVKNLEGVDLGIVDHLFASGANDVIVIKGERERLVPYLRDQVVMDVDLVHGVMTVDWDSEF